MRGGAVWEAGAGGAGGTLRKPQDTAQPATRPDTSPDPQNTVDTTQREDTALAARIHRLRTARGLSQRELAEPRYTAAYISSVESGRRTPSGEALEHIAKRLGVTVGELRTGRAADAGLQIDLALAETDAAWPAAVGGEGAEAVVTGGSAGGESASAAGDTPSSAVSPAAATTAYQRIADHPDATPAQRAHALVELGHIALRAVHDHGDPAALTRAAAHFEEAEAVLTAAGASAVAVSEATAGRAAALRWSGDARYATFLLAQIRDELIADGLPDPVALLTVFVQLAVCHGELGDDLEAARAAREALRLAGRGEPGRVADLYLASARTLVDAGRLADAALALAQARGARREAALRPKLAWCYRARGRDAGRLGDLLAAQGDLATAQRLFLESGEGAEAVDCAVELAEVHIALGQPGRAAELIAELGAICGDPAVDGPITDGPITDGPITDGRITDSPTADPGPQHPNARILRLKALMATGSADREHWFRRAVADYRRTGPRNELARTVTELADLLETAGRADEAIEVLRAGVADVQRLSAV